MNDHQIQSFLVAADEKSFSKAAALSHISVPAFIQQIRLLEEDLGFRLFDRSPRGITLTTAGNDFYKDARKILKIYSDACERGRRTEQMENLSFRAAYSDESIPEFFLSAINEYRKELPDLKVEFKSIPFAQYIDAVSDHLVDLAAIAEPADSLLKDLTFFPLSTDYFSFCMHPDHPLASCTILTAEQLKDYTIVCGRYEYLKDSFEQALGQLDLRIRSIESEYTMSFRIGQLGKNELFVLHSMWSQAYTRYFRVVPSNIHAGRIGIICRKPIPEAVRNFLPYLQKKVMMTAGPDA